MLKWCRNKSELNLIIDALMYILAAGIVGIGFLIKYVLLPGRTARVVYGERTEEEKGADDPNPVKSLMESREVIPPPPISKNLRVRG